MKNKRGITNAILLFRQEKESKNTFARSSGDTARFYPIFFVCICLALSSRVKADEFFNPAFLSNDPDAIADLSRFEKGEGQAAGSYRVEIYLNDEYISTKDINFIPRKSNNKSLKATKEPLANDTDDTGLVACITRRELTNLNVKTDNYAQLIKYPLAECIKISEVIPMASTRFDFDKQRLYISIPQAALMNNIRGYIPPDEWDEGINAILLNYNFSGSNTKNDDSHGSMSSYFLGLNSGVNFNSWRLRNYSTWNISQGNNANFNQWQNISTYAQRDIIPFKSSLTLGDSYTSGDIFTSIGFRGAQLASDDNMLPDSQRGFAPTVRGVANSNAKVTIRQNGYVIYQTYVSSGAFEITDLYPTSSSGDLRVTIAESNGHESSFNIPYSAVPVLQREGRIKYALTVGQYRSNSMQQDKPGFGQGTLIWGLPKGITVYGGSQFASRYNAFAIGAGINIGHWGAISADITQANSILADKSKHEGQSLRFLYAKTLNELGTNFQLLGYRYSTQGFYTLDETSYHHMSGTTVDNQNNSDSVKPIYNDYYNLRNTKKGQIQVNISQQLGKNGSLFLTGSRQTYWHTPQTNDLLQIGYSGYWQDVTYNVTYSYNHNPDFSDADKRVALNISLPIGKWLSGGGRSSGMSRSNNVAYGTYSANNDMHGHMTQQAGVSGTLLDNSNLSYSVQQGYTNHDAGKDGSVNLSYQGRYGNSNIGYNYSKGYRQVNYGMSGGVVGHSDGITFSQPLGDTNILIKASGASGVNVENTTGVSTDWRGYAVMPYAATYRLNRVALDTTTLKDNADLDDTVANVVPTLGALVRAEFKTRIGVRALISLKQANGKVIPFGATVDREDGNGGSIVGDNGQVYLSGLPLDGKLNVKWGNASSQSCTANYSLSKNNEIKVVNYAKAECL